MVDRTNLQQVNMLYGELNAIDAAERGFDNGGVIVSMEVSMGPIHEADLGPMGIRVPTAWIKYPPQMVEGIKASFAERRQQIASQLEEMGLTGIAEQPGPTTPASAPTQPTPSPTRPVRRN